jgi:hypothetical protein
VLATIVVPTQVTNAIVYFIEENMAEFRLERNEMDTVLTWIGFDDVDTRNRIRLEGFNEYSDLLTMNEKDIRDLAESYSRRTVADGRFIFGVRRIKHLLGLIHWVQDFQRVGEDPSLQAFGEDQEMFKDELSIAYYRAEVRKVEKDQSDTVSKAADPGKFKDERKWPEWEPAFVNYLSTIPGVNGVPLSYVVREVEAALDDAEYITFNEKAIAKSPLMGPTFQADSRKVHQLLKSYLQAESADQWIKPLARHQCGRQDMKSLRDHYSGEGNTSRRIAVAERLRDTLHYKNERSLQFSSFLDKLQKMFNIFEEENEPISDQAKVRMLLKKIEHPQLQDTIGALKVRSNMDGITFTECANHLSAQVSELPDYQLARKVSALKSGGKGNTPTKKVAFTKGDAGSKRKGIMMPDGTVWTGYYGEWNQLSAEDKQKVMDTRQKNKANGVRGGGSKSPAKGNIRNQIAELKRQLSAIQSNKSGDDDEDDTIPDNAGDAFGGRQSSKKQKKE